MDAAKRTAIIIGAGPAGLTAAYELLTRTNIQPIILERSPYIGGISKTINYKGNRIDIGGHRFFSKSDRVMQWWLNMMPIETTTDQDITIHYQNKTTTVKNTTNNVIDNDKKLLVRKRVSRIYYLKKFFNYPVSLSIDTLKKLGIIKVIRIGASYVRARLLPVKEDSLEDFFINRFGRELYLTFFKDYTEKVWSVPCSKIPAEWGAQRIKTLTIGKALRHAAKQAANPTSSIKQKDTETSLIEQFLYPKYGPGQMWEEAARRIVELGGIIIQNKQITRVAHTDNIITSVTTQYGEEYKGDYFFSTMPVKELINGFMPAAPREVKEVADGLIYRDFITVGLLLDKLVVKNEEDANKLIQDNWIYIQEHEVKIGRLQIFNNWSPYMVKDNSKVWIGLEYFCSKGDTLWQMEDAAFITFAINELTSIGIIDKNDVLDSTIIREEKTYPAYFGTYNKFQLVRDYTDSFPNLFLIGRNGMHKYNNSDHSMLTAMTAVNNIIAGIQSKDNIWAVNTEQEYLENKPA